MPSQNLARIKHIVVVMLENRSFDNVLGFLYADQENRPERNLPVQDPPTYDGLLPENGSDRFWNPSNADFFQGQPAVKVAASCPTTGASPFTVPNPDPNELFANFNFQLFGTAAPTDEQVPSMQGFFLDFLKAKGVAAATAQQIMESYSPDQLPVLSSLAKNYAVCDRWFASVPAQTWPNRGFVHTGTSHGQVTNGNVFAYSTKTIYESLQERGISWVVYNDGPFMSLTRIQYPQLLDQEQNHFLGFDEFKSDAAGGTLPAYSFIEPSFLINPNDQHAPHDVRPGEKFLHDVWIALSTGPRWNETLLVITYDEHGGCYDHVAPPWGAAIPDDPSNPGQQGFRFNRFGVRSPAVVVSPLIEPGTVFRSPTATPYDHTSILATLRDWLSIPAEVMPPSLRIAAAPTLDHLLTRETPRVEVSDVPAAPAAPMLAMATQEVQPLNDLQMSMLIAAESYTKKRALTPLEKRLLGDAIRTKGAIVQHLGGHRFAAK